MGRFASVFLIALAGCSSGSTTSPSTTATASVAVPGGDATVKSPAASSRPIKIPDANTCGLAAPVKSDDACAADAECGPSDPCHAHACVAAAKAKPRTGQTMCTEIMDCKSTDANDCRCLEKRCALVPRR